MTKRRQMWQPFVLSLVLSIALAVQGHSQPQQGGAQARHVQAQAQPEMAEPGPGEARVQEDRAQPWTGEAQARQRETIVRTGDPYTRGYTDADFPRVQQIGDGVYAYEQLRSAGEERFTTVSMFVAEAAQAMDVDIYLPGHGFVETPEVLAEELETYRHALERVIAEATHHHAAGLTVDEAIEQSQFGDLDSWTLRASQGPTAIRRVYMELNGELNR